MPDFSNPFEGNNLGRKLNKGELIRALRFSIAAEYEATQIYEQIAESVDDEGIRNLMKDVAEEEIVHAGEFMRALKNIYPEEAKFYQEGENEATEVLMGRSKTEPRPLPVTAKELVNRLDKIADKTQKKDPKYALRIDRISDEIEDT